MSNIVTEDQVLIDKVKKIDDVIEADPLHSEIRILDWIFYQVCSNENKKFERLQYKSRSDCQC